MRPTETVHLALVQVQGIKRALNHPTYWVKNGHPHPIWTQTDGPNGYLGHRSTLVLGGVWNPCLRIGGFTEFRGVLEFFGPI